MVRYTLFSVFLIFFLGCSNTQVKTEQTLKADFGLKIVEQLDGFEIQTINNSIGNAVKWEWDLYQDGTIESNKQNCSFEYSGTEKFSVSLKISDNKTEASITKSFVITKETADVTEVLFWHAMGGPLGDALIGLVDEFNETFLNIHINAINMGNYQALSQKIMASIQADAQPDIAQVYGSWTDGLIKGDKIISMNEFIDNDDSFGQEDLEDFFPIFIKENTIDNKLWSFPFNKSVRVLYYNKDLFFQNNLDPNKPPITWNDFKEYCKTLTIDENNDGIPEIYGTTFAINAWQFENLLLQAGGSILSEDMKKAEFNKEPGIKAMNFLTDLLNKDKTAYLSTGYEGQNDFLAGKVAMVEGSSVSLAYMGLNGIDFLLGVAAVPVEKTKKNLISGTNVVIFRKKDKEVGKAAWEFLKWFTEARQTAHWSEKTYYMPVRKSAFEEPALKERMELKPEIASVYGQLKYAGYEPPIKQWFEARKQLEE